MKILNLYACLGGNRYKWNEVENNIQVTAVEIDTELAELYQKRFPNDIVIIADAHQYLLEHYTEFDFIWSSPPCPSHSKARFARKETTIPVYPDLKLYEEIIFLQNYFSGKYCVENVIPFYEPLLPGQKRGRHLYWTNFALPANIGDRSDKILIGKSKNEVKEWCIFHDYDFYQYKGNQRKDKIARNLVDYEAGKNIFMAALNIYKKSNTHQTELFQ
jgi:DNA (cytosine-5)-methyltransferase 1